MIRSTYGDSCRTGDDKYVLAQFRFDANLDWVGELRAFLVKDELKYKEFALERQRVQANTQLWKRVLNGISHAEIFIVDPAIYKEFAVMEFREQQAEPGIDFDLGTIHEVASIRMIKDSPLAHIATLEYDLLSDNTFSAFRAGEFTPSMLRKRVGGKLNDVIVLAARSQAVFSSVGVNERLRNLTLWRVGDADTRDLLEMQKAFDIEHPGSIPVLNEALFRFGRALGLPTFLSGLVNETALVREEDSRQMDHIQAADMAAGWAADQLSLNGGEYRTVAQLFSRVNVNGHWLAPR